MTPLERLIRLEIQTTGPLRVSRYMELCLSHPTHGYYRHGEPIGASGDFVTAPEISQMFGELIGTWMIEVWRRLGQPSPFALVELGPGRGTLMADIWRTLRIEPACQNAASIHLIETHPGLRTLQVDTLRAAGTAVTHHTALQNVPALPTLVVANEFLDALPTNQWVRTKAGWNARMIGLDDKDHLHFGVDRTPQPAPKPTVSALAGTILEHSPAQDALMVALAQRLKQFGGAALFIDYGSLTPGFGDTLQAVKNHAPMDALDEPGAADLSTHVDFAHLATIVRDQGLNRLSAGHQGDFLLGMGLLERAQHLGKNRSPDEQEAIRLAVERLAGDAQMGTMFKVMGLAADALDLPALSPMLPPTARSVS